MKIPKKLVSMKRLEQYFSSSELEKFLEWYKAQPRIHQSKYAYWVPTDKEIKIYHSWLTGQASMAEVLKAFGMKKTNGTAYTRLAYIGKYLAK